MNKINNCNNCKNNKCSKCGECCGSGLPISLEEVNIIKDYINKHNIEPEPLMINRDGVEGFNAMCCFLDQKTNKCKIYDVRPWICRTYQCNQSEEEIIKNRTIAHQKAYYNHCIDNNSARIDRIATFNDIFYNDPTVLIQRAVSMLPDNMPSEQGLNLLKLFFQNSGRKDIADDLVLINNDTLTLKSAIEWKDDNDGK